MGRRIRNFSQSLARHGFWPTLVRYVYVQLRRLIDFEICRVESGSEDPYTWPKLEGYEVRAVDEQQFHDNLCEELSDARFDSEFQRGDLCIAALCEGTIVAYDFTSKHPSRVKEGLEFTFPDEFSYGMVTTTAPAHRGRKIARELWRVSRQIRLQREGRDVLRIWYVNATNLESRAANVNTGTKENFQGYAGYLRLFGRWHVFASPRCRRFGAGFRQSDSYTPGSPTT
jgi:hypothetical protein